MFAALNTKMAAENGMTSDFCFLLELRIQTTVATKMGVATTWIPTRGISDV